MRSIVIVIAFASVLVSCSSSKTVSNKSTTQSDQATGTGGDGSSFENAVVIMEKSEMKGVDAEYAWLRKNFPGYRSKGQSLVTHNKKPYDIIKISTAQGEEKEVYFDISNFYGKF